MTLPGVIARFRRESLPVRVSVVCVVLLDNNKVDAASHYSTSLELQHKRLPPVSQSFPTKLPVTHLFRVALSAHNLRNINHCRL